MTHRFRPLRRFRFNLPQRIAAGLLALFLLQGVWLTSHQTPTDRDYQYARCGREMWERPSLAGRLLHQLRQYSRRHPGLPAGRVATDAQSSMPSALGPLSQARGPRGAVWTPSESAGNCAISLLICCFFCDCRFSLAGCVLGGGFWWVTRRLYGNLGGYTALALYCFSPAVLKACVTPNPEVLAALGVYGGVYTSIGVAHAMQGPRRKWRPRIVLLTVIFGIAAAAHIAALPVAALLGLAAMLWVAEGRRSQVLPVVLAAASGALALVFACYGFSPDAFSYLFRSAAGFLWFSLDPARRFFSTLRQRRHHGGRGCGARAVIWPRAGRATSAIRLRCSAPWS